MSNSKKSAARAVADVTAGMILATVEIEAPPERVFHALTASEDIVKWWGSEDAYRTTEWTADVRPGGRWRAGGVSADGSRFSVGGEFLEVDAPHKLVQTWVADWDGGNTTTITYRIEAIDGGTRITLRHDGFAGRAESCRGHSEGWERVLGWLTRFVAPAEGARYFMCRLIPPRPSFAFDMNDAERAVMNEHILYWRDLLNRGVAIVFGPVADPKGPFGLGVIRAKSEEEMHALRDGDPTIKSGLDFRYEIAPMLRAVHRE